MPRKNSDAGEGEGNGAAGVLVSRANAYLSVAMLFFMGQPATIRCLGGRSERGR